MPVRQIMTNCHFNVYIHRQLKAGIEGVSGLLEYPTKRITEEVLLTQADEHYIAKAATAIVQVVSGEQCPGRIESPKCKKCI